MFFSKFFQGFDGLLPVSRIMIDKGYFLAGNIASIFIKNMVDCYGSTIPVITREIEYPLENCTVFCRGSTITHGMHWDLIDCNLWYELICNTSRKWCIHKRTFPLGCFVTFYTLLSVVTRFTLNDLYQFTADTPITFIQKCKVIRETICSRNSAR